MTNTSVYHSPLGDLLLASDGTNLTGCWFEGQKYYAAGVGEASRVSDPVLLQASTWLDQYFAGKQPATALLSFAPQVTNFRRKVLEVLQAVEFGQVISYKKLAEQVVGPEDSGKYARAVAAAVGHNPLSIFIGCHRVVGSDGSLTGYAGGLERKRALLEFEQQPSADFWQKFKF